MSLTVAVQMDHISTIRIGGDSTFALMLEAQRRGHRLLHYTPDRMAMTGKSVAARVEPVEVADVEGAHYALGDAYRMDLADADVVLLRQEPPFDMAYVTSTHMLDLIHPKTLVVNDPASVRNAPEKVLVMTFPQLMPETVITRDVQEVKDFRKQHGDIVIKPLYGHGGQSVFRVRPEDENFGSLMDLFTSLSREPFVVQRYLPAVRAGDKRIILVEGEFAGAVNRVPAADDLRSNMVRGGAAQTTELTDREAEICATIGPELKRLGLLFVGIDVIGGFLTEINVTCPTGIRAIRKLGGPDIAARIWDAIEAKVAAKAD
ncbi:Glutathione synthetase [Hartmannibacter diazotrophicus]|uniref:Glutathione synthetase n=1 Tax=Hartmannibacter diazotrophicus TaxID=1482074 RepID=A0A2C9D299_9HYPH|nr:glutathione synthase [Hartmannibacter diazotrophicus]SON53625.1 Glutathione synthetase [Hartmannibacter diazotrophicus]